MKKFKSYEEHQTDQARSDRSRTESYVPPEYVVQPAKGEKGFFMFKRAFDKMKKRFETGLFSTTVNNYD